MSKKLCCIVILAVLLTSCGNTQTTLLPYDTEANAIIETSTASAISLFADKLCVYSVDKNEKADTTLTAEATMLADITKKKILYANNIYEKVYPASITKLLTALVALKNGNLEDTVTITYNASHITESGATKCGFKEGDTIRLETLLYCFLVYSGNDAGIALAEHIAGSEATFVQMMNEEAKALGCVGSNFVNPHGLHDDNHYTTAYDVYLVFNELLHNTKYNKTFIDMICTKEYKATYKSKAGSTIKTTFSSTNSYLTGSHEIPKGVTVIGGKTGTTTKAGSCLALYSKDETGKEYLSFIFHASNRTVLLSQMDYLLKKIEKKEN